MTRFAQLAFAASLLLVFAFPARAEQKIIIAHGISAFGDLKYPADFKHFEYVNPDAPKGGTYSSRGTGASKTFDSLNPFILKGEPAQGLGLLFDSLLVSSADEPDSMYGLVAETLEYPEDRSWVIFNMRPEARFHDGSPVTAEDVVFSLNILKEQGHPVYAISYRDIESAEALTPHRVKFTFREGASMRDMPMVAGGISILSKAYYTANDFSKSTMSPPVGSGQYTVESTEAGRTITYKRNPEYWGKDLPVSVGTFNFDRIVYEYFGDNTASFEAFKAGNYLFHEEFFSKIWATEYNFPSLEKGWVVRESIPDGRPSGTQGFWINTRRDKFKDPRVREAISIAFNFEWSNEKLFFGLYTRTDSFWENSNLQAEGTPSPEELALLEPLKEHIPASVFEGDVFTPIVSRPVQTDRRALRRATQLLSDAGWTIVDGMRTNDKGEKLSLEFVDDGPGFERIILPFVENLRLLGIDASFRLIDAAQMQQRQEDFDYDMVGGRLVMSLTPGPELSNYFGSQSRDKKGTLNLAGVSNPGVDALVDHIIAAKSREEVGVAVRALDRVLRAMHIWVPNWYKASHNIAYWDVFSRPDTKPLYARGVIPTWWWDEEKAARLKAAGAL